MWALRFNPRVDMDLCTMMPLKCSVTLPRMPCFHDLISKRCQMVGLASFTQYSDINHDGTVNRQGLRVRVIAWGTCVIYSSWQTNGLGEVALQRTSNWPFRDHRAPLRCGETPRPCACPKEQTFSFLEYSSQGESSLIPHSPSGRLH